MKVRSKRYRKAAELVDPKKKYEVDEAVRILKKMPPTKFNQTVTLALTLNIDAKKSEQGVRGSVALPHGIGKARKVVVFADGPEAEAARNNGAAEVGMEDLAKKVSEGWTDFDVAVAVQRAMKVVSRLGKVLGPAGKMPSPKNGTIVPDGKVEEMGRTVKEFAAGRVEFRNDAQGNIHLPVGKISFSEQQLKENIVAFVDHVKSMRPSQVKGHFILSASVQPAMGPGLKLTLAPC